MRSLFVILLVTVTLTIKSQELTDKVLERQIHTESRGKHLKEDGTLITSPAGAKGVAQFMPDTWNWMKNTSKLIPSYYDINNEDHQRKAHVIYMQYLYKASYGEVGDSQLVLALASYNAGINRVKRLINKYGESWKSHLPVETKEYLTLINN